MERALAARIMRAEMRGETLFDRQAGQAAVESALTLPLMTFVMLGTLQLFMMLQGRILAQYAVARAVRAGSMNYGDCTAMRDTAIAALMPAIVSFASPSQPGATYGAKLANNWKIRSSDQYSAAADRQHTSPSFAGAMGDIVWLAREQPTVAQVSALPNGQDQDFDQWPRPPMRLEVRMIFWFPLRIPFANWVMSYAALARYGLNNYTAANPLELSQKANWTGSSPAWLTAVIQSTLQSRVLAGEYVFPIEATYTMRMMTPAKASNFTVQNCPPAPSSL